MIPDREDYFELKEEKRQARRDRFMLMAGMSNFFSVIIGTVLVLLLILLIVSLLSWLSRDIQSSFALFNSRF
jgi:hypothetical protein